MNDRLINKLDIFFKLLTLILFFALYISAALVYKFFAKTTISSTLLSDKFSTSHLIKINSGINSKIIYNNKVYYSKATIEIEDNEIIPKLNFNNLNYAYNAIHAKVITILGAKNITYKYKIYKKLIPIDMRINNNKKNHISSNSTIKTYNDYISFWGYTIPHTKIYTSLNSDVIVANKDGFFCINRYVKKNSEKFSITFKKKNFKQTKYSYFLKHLTRKLHLKVYSDDITYYDCKALISGVTDKGAKIDVYGINLISMPTIDDFGNFEFYAKLKDGVNRFTIVSRKEKYESAIKTVNVNYSTY